MEGSRYIVQGGCILSVYEGYHRRWTRIVDLLGPQLAQRQGYWEVSVFQFIRKAWNVHTRIYVPLLQHSECTRHSRWLGGSEHNRARDVGYELGVLSHYLPTLIGRCRVNAPIEGYAARAIAKRRKCAIQTTNKITRRVDAFPAREKWALTYLPKLLHEWFGEIIEALFPSSTIHPRVHLGFIII